MRVRVGDIQPNPFRHIDRYPIRPEKVAALRESLRTTGFWGNVVARVRDGKPEIAYGHHRLAALRDEYGPKEEVDLIVRDLSDEVMLQIMARENMEEWGTSAAVEQETVRAVVEAFAAGQIELEAPRSSGGDAYRFAPSFIPDRERAGALSMAYTPTTVARFLGWVTRDGRPQAKVGDALAALQLIEEGVLAEADFDGLTTSQAGAVVEQTRAARASEQAAARLAKREAEQAARAAEDAARERQAAQARAAAAADAEERRRAEAEAKQAEEAQRTAERRQRAETQQAEKQEKRAHQQASAVGRHVSQQIRSGSIGYKGAAGAAATVRPAARDDAPPPDITQYAGRLARKLGRFLEEDSDDRRGLEQLIRFREHLREREHGDLVLTLDVLRERIEDLAARLAGEPQETVPLNRELERSR